MRAEHHVQAAHRGAVRILDHLADARREADARTGLGAQAAAPLAATQAPAPGTSAGQAIVALIQKEVGQAEQPPGSSGMKLLAQ